MNDVPRPILRTIPDTRRVIVTALIVAAVGALLVALGFLVDPVRTRYAYLAAFAGVTALSLGGLVLLMIVHAMDASWPVVVRRPIEATAAPLSVLPLAFLPIVAWVPELYAWAAPSADTFTHHDLELLDHKAGWLDHTSFTLRAALYFASFIAVAVGLRTLSHRQDREPDPRHPHRSRVLSVAALPVIALTLTFASFDWVMSLDPLWVSTIFGLYWFGGGFCAAIAVLVIVVGAFDRAHLFDGFINPSHYHAIGRLLLTGTCLWGYFAFFQLMLIWIANRPDEVAFYIDRTDGAWEGVAVTLALLHLAIPLVALLSYRLKRQARPLAVVALVMLLAHVVDMHWLVVPRSGSTWPVHWIDPGPWLLLGGLAVAWSAWRLRGRPAAPRHDPRLARGTRYHSE